LHHALSTLGPRVGIGQGEQIAALGRADAEILGQLRDERLPLLRRVHLQVHVGHGDQLLDVGTTDQGAAKHGDLLIDVGLDGKTRHQRAQHGLRVDENARAGFVLVRHLVDHDARNDADDPGERKAPPPEAPHAAQVAGDL